jgi:hypothetical protein
MTKRFVVIAVSDSRAMIMDSEMNDRVVAVCSFEEEAVAIALHLNGEHEAGDRVHLHWLDKFRPLESQEPID